MLDVAQAMPDTESMVKTKVFFSVKPVQELLRRRGIDNPHAFAEASGISYPTARVWWAAEPMGRIDAPTLATVARFLDVDWRLMVNLIEESEL